MPASPSVYLSPFLECSRHVLDCLEQASEKEEHVLTSEERRADLHALNHAAYTPE